jgi:hypothetical protein
VQTIDGDSWLRTDDYGVVDRLDTEAIVTSFYTVIVPVWPEHSAYVIRGADGSEQRIKIPLQARSVALGYLRVSTWLAALMLALPAVMLPDRWLALLVPGIGLSVLAAILTFVAGRLDESEQRRRSLLRRVVGFGAPPELLSESVRAEIRTNLELMWKAKAPQLHWAEAIDHGDPSELLVALAEYHQEPELLARAHANACNKLWN